MAVISPSSFDALKAYVNVRLQQGVPIADADWNEMDDIRKFELRAFLKWHIGDGIPAGSDGFRIGPASGDNDFTILSGLPGSPAVSPAAAPAGLTTAFPDLKQAGWCLVDGMEVFIAADIRFTEQALHEARGDAASAEARRLGVPVIDALPPPAADASFAVYLDVWERLVYPAEDPSLVLQGLNVETCARVKREWAVRVRAGAAAPAPGDPGSLAGHSYYLLAIIARRANQPAIGAGDIQDRRRTQLTLANVLDMLQPSFADPGGQIIPDVQAVGATVALFGDFFTAGPVVVQFGSPAAEVRVPRIKSGRIDVQVPPAAVTGKITVITPAGAAVSDEVFTVLPVAQ